MEVHLQKSLNDAARFPFSRDNGHSEGQRTGVKNKSPILAPRLDRVLVYYPGGDLGGGDPGPLRGLIHSSGAKGRLF